MISFACFAFFHYHRENYIPKKGQSDEETVALFSGQNFMEHNKNRSIVLANTFHACIAKMKIKLDGGYGGVRGVMMKWWYEY